MSDISQDGQTVRVNMGEARQRLTDLVEMMGTGTRVFLMKRGIPVAEIVPVEPIRISTEGTPEEHARAREIAVERGLIPPPPPPPEERPRVAPKPPKDREVSLDQTQREQAARDAILRNLGGKKKKA